MPKKTKGKEKSTKVVQQTIETHKTDNWGIDSDLLQRAPGGWTAGPSPSIPKVELYSSPNRQPDNLLATAVANLGQRTDKYESHAHEYTSWGGTQADEYGASGSGSTSNWHDQWTDPPKQAQAQAHAQPAPPTPVTTQQKSAAWGSTMPGKTWTPVSKPASVAPPSHDVPGIKSEPKAWMSWGKLPPQTQPLQPVPADPPTVRRQNWKNARQAPQPAAAMTPQQARAHQDRALVDQARAYQASLWNHKSAGKPPQGHGEWTGDMLDEHNRRVHFTPKKGAAVHQHHQQHRGADSWGHAHQKPVDTYGRGKHQYEWSEIDEESEEWDEEDEWDDVHGHDNWGQRGETWGAGEDSWGAQKSTRTRKDSWGQGGWENDNAKGDAWGTSGGGWGNEKAGKGHEKGGWGDDKGGWGNEKDGWGNDKGDWSNKKDAWGDDKGWGGDKGGWDAWGDEKKGYDDWNGRPDAAALAAKRSSSTPYTMPSRTLSYALDDSAVQFENGRPTPNQMNTYANVRFIESKGAALEPVKNALFGRQRLARDRIHWMFDPHKDERVSSLLEWLEKVKYDIGSFGLHKFLQTRERGALFVNADYRPPGSPNEPAFDWKTFDQLQGTMDPTLQESTAFYDPSIQVIVFVFLPSESCNSIAIWRRKFVVPNNIKLSFSSQVATAISMLRAPKGYVIHLDEPRKRRTTPKRSVQPATTSVTTTKTELKPTKKQKRKRKRKWWRLWLW